MVLSMASHTPPRRSRWFFPRWETRLETCQWREVLRIDPLLAAAGNSAALQLFGDVGSSGFWAFWFWLKGWEGLR